MKASVVVGVLSSLLSVEGGLTGSKGVKKDASFASMTVSVDGSLLDEKTHTAFVQVTSDTTTSSTTSNTCAQWSEDCEKQLRSIEYFAATVGCNRYSSLCDKKLNEIIFPGTTYSAFSKEETIKDWKGAIVSDDGRIHQPVTLKSQLEAGIRYIDIAVGLDTSSTLVAATGFRKDAALESQLRYLYSMTLKEALDTIEDFLSSYVNDIVIVDFSAYAPDEVVIAKSTGNVPQLDNPPTTSDGAILVADDDVCYTNAVTTNVTCVAADSIAVYHSFTAGATVDAMKEFLEARYVPSSTKDEVSQTMTGSYDINFLIPKKEWTAPTMTLADLISNNQRLGFISDQYLTASLEEVVLSGQNRADPTAKKSNPVAVYPSQCGTASADRSLMLVDYTNFNTLESDARRKVAYNTAAFRADRGTSWASKELSRCWTAQVNKGKTVNFLATDHFDAMRPTVLDITSELNVGSESPAMSIWLDMLIKTLMLILLFSVIASATGYLAYQQIVASAKPPQESFKPENALPPGDENAALLDGQNMENLSAEMRGDWTDIVTIVDAVKASIMLVRPEFAGGDPMPPKWKRYIDDESGQVYFFHHETGNSAWESEVWVEYGSDEEGGRYMHNVVSQRSVWMDDWDADCVARGEAEAKAMEEYEKALAEGAVEVTQEEFDAAVAENAAQNDINDVVGELADETVTETNGLLATDGDYVELRDQADVDEGAEILEANVISTGEEEYVEGDAVVAAEGFDEVNAEFIQEDENAYAAYNQEQDSAEAQVEVDAQYNDTSDDLTNAAAAEEVVEIAAEAPEHEEAQQ